MTMQFTSMNNTVLTIRWVEDHYEVTRDKSNSTLHNPYTTHVPTTLSGDRLEFDKDNLGAYFRLYDGDRVVYQSGTLRDFDSPLVEAENEEI